MALLHADSFDHYGTDSGNLTDGLYGEANGAMSTTTVRTGTYSFDIGSGNLNKGLSWVPASNTNTIGVGFGLYMSSLPSSPPDGHVILFDSLGVEILSLVWISDGSIQLKRGNRSGTVLAVSDIALTAAAWNHVEFKAVVDDIVGSIEIRINSKTVMSVVDLNLGTNLIASVAFMRFGNRYYIDDLIIWDDTGDYNNDFMGPARVKTVFPDGDSTPSDWTANGASNPYECVDEANPDDDSSYISAATADLEVTFTLPELPPEIISLQGIYIPVRAALSEAGIGKITPAIISNSVRADGSEQTLTSAYTYRGQVFEVNPDTGVAFTASEFSDTTLSIVKTA